MLSTGLLRSINCHTTPFRHMNIYILLGAFYGRASESISRYFNRNKSTRIAQVGEFFEEAILEGYQFLEGLKFWKMFAFVMIIVFLKFSG